MGKQFLVVFGVILFLLLNFVNGQSTMFSIDPCPDDTIITEDSTKIYVTSTCFDVTFPKNYGDEIFAFDKYNDDFFDLKALQLYDEKTSNPNDYKTISFQDKPMIASYSGNIVYYMMNDGVNDITLFYTVYKNQFKQGIEINNWVSNWDNGDLVLRTKYHKDNLNSHFENQPAIVDSVEQEMIVESITEQESTFYRQTLWSGKSFTTLFQDPLYLVDYSPIPAVHLINGEVDTEPDSSFDATIDITTGVSDNNTFTNYEVRYGSIYTTNNPDLLLSYNLDETNGSVVYDKSGNDYDGDVMGDTDLTATGILNTGIYLDGDNDYIYRNVSNGDLDLEIGEEGMYCISFNTTDYGVIFSISSGSASSMRLEMLSNGRLKATMKRTGGATTISSSSTYNDGNWHTTCLGTGELNVMYLFADGIFVGSATQSLNAKQYNEMRLGVAIDLTDDYEGELDEFCIWQGSISLLALTTEYETNKCGEGNEVIIEEGKGISVRFSETYNSTYSWFLEIYQNTAGTTNYTTYAYNSTDTISDMYVTKETSSTGWISQNVSELMDYMLNTVGLNYTAFRLYTEDSHYISEVRLRQLLNDNTSPTINNCFINDTYIGCFETSYIECNITDDSMVSRVYYQSNGVNYTANQLIDKWYYYFNLEEEGNTFYDWEYIYAYDLLNNLATNDPNINLTYYCIADDYINIKNYQVSVGFFEINITWDTDRPSYTRLKWGNTTSLGNLYSELILKNNHSVTLTGLVINTTYYYNISSFIEWLEDVEGMYNVTTGINCEWEANYQSCLLNDTQIKYYVEINGCGRLDGLPFDNGTYVYCNYCSEDLVPSYLTECQLNGSSGIRQVQWFDNNYFSCCALTGIISDCSIDYSPFNDSYYENCTFLYEDFVLDVDSELYFGWGFGGLNSDKVHGKIWINDTNGTYTCLSYVKTLAGQIVQTNPPYTKRTDNIISIIPKEIEDREFFITQNGLANIYWTDDNLVIDGRFYVFGVECSKGGSRLISEKSSKVLYDNVNTPVTRWFWFINNMWAIILGMILLFFIVLTIAWYIKELRGR